MSALYQRAQSLNWLKAYAIRGFIGFRRSALTIGASFLLGTTYVALAQDEKEIRALQSDNIKQHRTLQDQRDTMLYNQTLWLQKHYDEIRKEVEDQKKILRELKEITSSLKGKSD